MVNKLIAKLLVAIAAFALVVIICQEQPSVPTDAKVVLEMTMYPIQDSDGEYILEYREFTHSPVIRREVLKKDGKRHSLTDVEKK